MCILSAKEQDLTVLITGIGDAMQCGQFVRGRKGFTLIELMIVLSIIGILASIAVPNYQKWIIRAKEASLSDSLNNFRKTIDEYYADQAKYPDSLGDLVAKGYLRGLPVDPFTKKSDTWITVAPPEGDSIIPGSGSTPVTGTKEPGNVYDVHSGSNLIGTNGVPYNEW